MGEDNAQPFPVATKSDAFELHVTTDEEYARGEWREIPCGLEVLLAPSGTQEAERIQAAMLKKYGGGQCKRVEDLPAAKVGVFGAAVIARANFLGFRAPGGVEVVINDEIYPDNLQTRERIILEIPMIRGQVAEEIRNLQHEYGTEQEEAAGN